MAQVIGFIGLGIMGRPMAKNLLKAGYSLLVHNRSRAAVDELTQAGAKAETSPKDVAAQCDLLITMLPNSPDVELVALGKDGIIEGARAGLVYIDMSTISPIVSQKVGTALAARGVKMLDAPVSGGERGAIDAAAVLLQPPGFLPTPSQPVPARASWRKSLDSLGSGSWVVPWPETC